MPLVNPVTVIGLAGPIAVMSTGLDVTVYNVIVQPPFDAGGVNLTVACAFPAAAITAVGAPGTVPSATLLEGPDAGPVPSALVARTVNV